MLLPVCQEQSLSQKLLLQILRASADVLCSRRVAMRCAGTVVQPAASAAPSAAHTHPSSASTSDLPRGMLLALLCTKFFCLRFCAEDLNIALLDL